MKFKNYWWYFCLCGNISVAAAGCRNLPPAQAQAAAALISRQTMVIEYCEKCLSPLHRLIGIRTVKAKCLSTQRCRVLLNDEEVDVSHLFAELTTDTPEENIGFAVGCTDALLYNPRFLKFKQ